MFFKRYLRFHWLIKYVERYMKSLNCMKIDNISDDNYKDISFI